MVDLSIRSEAYVRTISRVFAARSLTNGLAIAGMRCDALIWPFWLLTRSSDMLSEQCARNKNEGRFQNTSGGKSGVIEGREGDSDMASFEVMSELG
jgi:hypothetical protein